VAAFGVGIDQESATGVGLGFVIALITLVSWALTRMFIGVAQDIKAIRAKVESS
jgi:flagellar biogenesis protein FliO